MVTSYAEWVKAVRREYEKLDACHAYLSEDGKIRRSQFGVLMSTTWIYDEEADGAAMLNYVRRNEELCNMIHLYQALKCLEQIVEGLHK